MILSTLATLANTTMGRVRRRTSTTQCSMAFGGTACATTAAGNRRTSARARWAGAFRFRRRVRAGPADFDATLEYGAVLDTDARGLNVADHRAVPFDLHPITGIHITADFAVNCELARRDSRV